MPVQIYIGISTVNLVVLAALIRDPLLHVLGLR